MKEKFTQGNWKVDNVGLTGDLFDITFNDDGECIAEHVHTKADAHLVAQAPAMYREIEQDIKMLKEVLGNSMFDCQAFHELKVELTRKESILAKARGENVN